MLRIPILVVLALILAGLVLFGLQNQELVTVHFLTYAWPQMPLWAPAMVAGFGTAALCLLYGLAAGASWQLRYRRLSRYLQEHKETAERLERENLELREKVMTSHPD
jgi:uncharacterized integral membrane protein